MPTVALYQLPHSPFCLPIAQTFRALGVAFTPVNVSNGNRATIIELTRGAAYEVPVLVHGDRVVFESGPDSQDVARYVDTTFGSGRLFPPNHDGTQAVLLAFLEHEVEGVTFRLTDLHYVPSIPDLVERVMVIRHKERRFGRGCLDQWQTQRAALIAQAHERLRPFERMLEHTPFLLGNQPVYSDFLLHGILGNLTWNQWNPFPPLPQLQAWYTRLDSFRYG